jgi:hypothetical protein
MLCFVYASALYRLAKTRAVINGAASKKFAASVCAGLIDDACESPR